MSQTNPSPCSEGDHGQNSIARHIDCDVARRDRDHERITDVAELEAGDRILVGDRAKPITVDATGSREQSLARDNPTQHTAEASGAWDGAKSVTLVTEIFLDGRRTGHIIADGFRDLVWRVDR